MASVMLYCFRGIMVMYKDLFRQPSMIVLELIDVLGVIGHTATRNCITDLHLFELQLRCIEG